MPSDDHLAGPAGLADFDSSPGFSRAVAPGRATPDRRAVMGYARVRLATFSNGGEKFAILQLDPVHRYVNFGDIDFFFLAAEEIVVARNIDAGVADVAEERAKRAVIVEREAERADRAVLRLELDRHVHGDSERRVNRPLDRVGLYDRRARLVGELMRRMVPQQTIGPAARLAKRISPAPGAFALG